MGNNSVESISKQDTPQVEYLADTLTIAETVAKRYDISLQAALSLLTFNELRCLHWHIDALHGNQEGIIKAAEKTHGNN